MEELKRGQIWYATYNDYVGSEEAVGRPVLIVSSDKGNETSSTIVGLFLTTKPRFGGYAVELSCTVRRSWVLCNQFSTVDKVRLTKKMCDVPESDMLKVELSVRNMLSLPLKNEALEQELEEKNTELENVRRELENERGGFEKYTRRIEELELELSVHKKMYERVLDKLVDERIERDCATRVVKVPEVVVEPLKEIGEPLDLIGLAEKFKVYDQRKEMSQEEVDATLEQAGMKKKNSTHGVGSGKAKLAPDAKTININTATLADFESVGIGATTAKNIVGWRKKHGLFVSVEDLLLVPRFGKGCLKTFESVLTV